MAYLNEGQISTTYQIVGSIDLSFMEYGNNRAHYSGKVFELFYETVCSTFEDLPRIIPCKTAFFIRYRKTKNGRNFNTREILALVDNVEEYTVNKADETCKLVFTFIEVPVNSYDPNAMILGPIISHVFSDKGFIALVFEGNSDFLMSYVNSKYRTFVHAGEVYWMIDTFQYTAHLRPGEPSIDTERPTLAIVVVASDLKVPRSDLKDEFMTMLEKHLNNIYGQSK
ncbi:hypothetical protein [uncultured Duncaniella sp.]|uniref:hypothetical protein n=1 Tax=uncultured Duncaniella sp. TaxID=2768039 RepID=UPI002638B482|nr:hypothetical protein [uncultured Duncaniella sp.]